MLSGVLSTILQNNQQYQDFQTKFSELFESDTSQIKTEFETIGNQVKIHLEKQLAKHIGENITQQQFETDLQIVFKALQKCWELAF